MFVCFFFILVSLIYFYKFLLFRPWASVLLLAERSRILSLLGMLATEQKTQLYSWKLPYKAFYTACVLCGFVKYKNLLTPLEMLNFEKYSSLACWLLFHASYFLSSCNLLLVVLAWTQDLVSSAALKRRHETLFFFLNIAAPLWIRGPQFKL